MRCLVLLVLSLGISACGESGRIPMPDTPLSAVPPHGFVHNTAMYTQYPSMHFNLKESRDHTTPMWPELSIEVLTSPTIHESPEAFIARIQAGAETDNRWVLRPRGTTAAAIPATEFAYRSSVVADSVGYGSTDIPIITHMIYFKYRDRRYLCELNSSPERYDYFVSSLYSLCNSIRFGT